MGKPPKKHGAVFRFLIVVESIQENEVAELARQCNVQVGGLIGTKDFE